MSEDVTRIYYRVAQAVMGWYGYILAALVIGGVASVLILIVYLIIHISSLG